MSKWHSASSTPPPEGIVVEVTTPTGEVTMLKRMKNLWFLPEGDMYVYYSPVMWRYLTNSREARTRV